MAKISELSDGGSLQSTDFLIAVRSGGNVKVQADGDLSLGTVTADGLTVDGNGSFSAGNVTLTLFETDTTDLNTRFRQNGGELLIRTTSDDGATDTTRMVIDHSTGDISFYEDTGTTAKLFWDASAESLGIGTTNPDTMLHLSSATNLQVLRFERTDTTVVADNPIGIIEFEHQDATDAGVAAKIEAAAENASGGVGLRFATGAPSSITERMRIDSNGNVDIKANITAAGPTLTLENTATAVNGQQWGAIHFKSNDSSTGASGTRASIVGTSTSFNGDGNITFSTAPASGSNTERMRIDSSGRVGINRTPSISNSKLEVGGADDVPLINVEASGVTGGMGIGSTGLQFFHGSSAKMRIDSSGNAGIGTSDPDTLLHLSSTGSYPTLRLERDDTAVASGNYVGRIEFEHQDTDDPGVAARIAAQASGTGGGVNLIFETGTPTSITDRLKIDIDGNLLVGGSLKPTSSAGNIVLRNGTAPTASATDSIVLYAEDVSTSSELKVRDEAGNVTTLSPHNFALIPEGPSEDMAWSYYSERDGKRINVDMLKAIRVLERLSGEQLVFQN